MTVNILTYTLFIFIWSFNAIKADPPPVVQNIQEQEQELCCFTIDYETLEFTELYKTTAAVDSLLALADFNRVRDARISFHVAKEALAISREIGYRNGEGRSHNLTAINYNNFGEYEIALEHYFAAIEIYEELGNMASIAILLNNIGMLYIENEQYEKGIEFLTAGIDLGVEIGQEDGAHHSYNNIGVAHRRQGNYDEALEYFYKTQRLALEERTDSLLHMIATLNIGNTYRNKGDLEQAPVYLNRAKEYFDRNHMKISQIYANLFLGQLYQDLQEYDTALEYAFTALELAREEMHRDRIKEAHEFISSIYEDTGNYEQAYHHFRLFHQVSDSLLNIQRSRRIGEMQIRFEVEQKDREIELLNREAELQEAYITQQAQLKRFLVTGVVMLVLIAGLLIRNNLEKKKNNKLLKKRREEIEEQNLLLANLNKEKDEFLSIAAHDLRNPVSVIITIMDLIQTEENMPAQELREYTELVMIAADRMLNLVNNLLDIQSINEGNHQIEMEKLDVKDALRQSLQHFRYSAESKNITLHTDLGAGEIMILGNVTSLIRVFDNLISNAIKYSADGADVFISATIDSNRVRIAIRDNGPGISPNDQKKLFTRFSRLSNKPTGKEVSTGLGLYIAKKLVIAMQGSIWCESKPGEGAVFYLEFPGLSEKH